jgi:hypothetical protein
MTTSSERHKAFFDVHPVTGNSIEVFFADRLATFGRGAGWFWQARRRGFAPNGPPTGPFSTSYSAFRNAMNTAKCTACATHGRAKTGPQG